MLDRLCFGVCAVHVRVSLHPHDLMQLGDCVIKPIPELPMQGPEVKLCRRGEMAKQGKTATGMPMMNIVDCSYICRKRENYWQ